VQGAFGRFDAIRRHQGLLRFVAVLPPYDGSAKYFTGTERSEPRWSQELRTDHRRMEKDNVIF
jgi:hypothetical protein